MFFLASPETTTGLPKAYLILPEAVIGLLRALLASLDACFQELAKRAWAKETFLWLHTHGEHVLAEERSCSNSSWSNWISNILAVDPWVLLLHYDTILSFVEKKVPSGVTILFSIKTTCWKYRRITSKRDYKNILQSYFREVCR